MTVKFDPGMIRAVLKMRLVEHKSMDATARRVGVATQTLKKFCQRRGLPTKNRALNAVDWNFSMPQPRKEQSGNG